MWSILLTMTIAATPVPLSEAKARLSELARRVRQQHERITLTRNGEPEAVLLSVDDLEGLEMTLEILGDADAVARISASLADGTRSGSKLPRGARSHSSCRRPWPRPRWSSVRPPWRKIRTGSANRCLGRWPDVTAPGGVPIASSTGSTTTAAWSTSSTSATARRSTAARSGDANSPQEASLIMPNTCPNRLEQDRARGRLRRSDATRRHAGGLDS